jgi:hypothetical protein
LDYYGFSVLFIERFKERIESGGLGEGLNIIALGWLCRFDYFVRAYKLDSRRMEAVKIFLSYQSAQFLSAFHFFLPFLFLLIEFCFNGNEVPHFKQVTLSPKCPSFEIETVLLLHFGHIVNPPYALANCKYVLSAPVNIDVADN